MLPLYIILSVFILLDLFTFFKGCEEGILKVLGFICKMHIYAIAFLAIFYLEAERNEKGYPKYEVVEEVIYRKVD